MTPSQIIAALQLLLFFGAIPIARGQDPIDFKRDIQPLFQQHCWKCHGGVHREGGLSLLAGGMRLMGDSGKPLIVAGNPPESELIRRVTTLDADERMPAEKAPLSPEQIARLRTWVEQGAHWPAHWSFAPLAAPILPAIKSVASPSNAIDAFVLHTLSSTAARQSPEADRYTLIRRLSLDLLGLPPTIDDADAFVADRSPDAYERLVDRLLSSPHFGERWGRHWLDQARYADSDGYEVDKARPDAYRWRDWVIDAVNRDVALDQFTIEQFAGDLLPDATPLTHLATAYHRQTLTNNEGGVDKEEYRFKAVMDRVSNTGSVWLGLTLACAQCHDHPYDPFTQREFYSLAAIFNSADETEIELPDLSSSAAKPRKFRVLTQRDSPRLTRLLNRGEFLHPGDEVAPALPNDIAFAPNPQSAIRNPQSSPPSRLDLARWLVDPAANPLTRRVQANQIWLHLFGQGLVRTPDDFGIRGEAPTHPELLDWLAQELLIHAWSRKALIRHIVSSATYRQSSHHRAELPTSDPQNRLLARQNRVRAEGEVVRDLWLATGGLLTTKIGGPSVFPPLGAEFVKITFRSELPWKTSPGEDRYRRGLYTFFKRSVPYPDLMIFDCPDANTAAVQRSVSNTPLQALAALNSETSLEAARGLARRALALTQHSHQARVEWMFRTCLTRPPTPTESSRLLNLFQTHRHWYEKHLDDALALTGDPHTAAAPSTTNAAPLTAIANVLINLDEFLTRE